MSKPPEAFVKWWDDGVRFRAERYVDDYDNVSWDFEVVEAAFCAGRLAGIEESAMVAENAPCDDGQGWGHRCDCMPAREIRKLAEGEK